MSPHPKSTVFSAMKSCGQFSEELICNKCDTGNNNPNITRNSPPPTLSSHRTPRIRNHHHHHHQGVSIVYHTSTSASQLFSSNSFPSTVPPLSRRVSNYWSAIFSAIRLAASIVFVFCMSSFYLGDYPSQSSFTAVYPSYAPPACSFFAAAQGSRYAITASQDIALNGLSGFDVRGDGVVGTFRNDGTSSYLDQTTIVEDVGMGNGGPADHITSLLFLADSPTVSPPPNRGPWTININNIFFANANGRLELKGKFPENSRITITNLYQTYDSNTMGVAPNTRLNGLKAFVMFNAAEFVVNTIVTIQDSHLVRWRVCSPTVQNAFIYSNDSMLVSGGSLVEIKSSSFSVFDVQNQLLSDCLANKTALTHYNAIRFNGNVTVYDRGQITINTNEFYQTADQVDYTAFIFFHRLTMAGQASFIASHNKMTVSTHSPTLHLTPYFERNTLSGLFAPHSSLVLIGSTAALMTTGLAADGTFSMSQSALFDVSDNSMTDESCLTQSPVWINSNPRRHGRLNFFVSVNPFNLSLTSGAQIRYNSNVGDAKCSSYGARIRAVNRTISDISITISQNSATNFWPSVDTASVFIRSMFPYLPTSYTGGMTAPMRNVNITITNNTVLWGRSCIDTVSSGSGAPTIYYDGSQNDIIRSNFYIAHNTVRFVKDSYYSYNESVPPFFSVSFSKLSNSSVVIEKNIITFPPSTDGRTTNAHFITEYGSAYSVICGDADGALISVRQNVLDVESSLGALAINRSSYIKGIQVTIMALSEFRRSTILVDGNVLNGADTGIAFDLEHTVLSNAMVLINNNSAFIGGMYTSYYTCVPRRDIGTPPYTSCTGNPLTIPPEDPVALGGVVIRFRSGLFSDGTMLEMNENQILLDFNRVYPDLGNAGYTSSVAEFGGVTIRLDESTTWLDASIYFQRNSIRVVGDPSGRGESAYNPRINNVIAPNILEFFGVGIYQGTRAFFSSRGFAVASANEEDPHSDRATMNRQMNESIAAYHRRFSPSSTSLYTRSSSTLTGEDLVIDAVEMGMNQGNAMGANARGFCEHVTFVICNNQVDANLSTASQALLSSYENVQSAVAFPMDLGITLLAYGSKVSIVDNRAFIQVNSTDPKFDPENDFRYNVITILIPGKILLYDASRLTISGNYHSGWLDSRQSTFTGVQLWRPQSHYCHGNRETYNLDDFGSVFHSQIASSSYQQIFNHGEWGVCNTMNSNAPYLHQFEAQSLDGEDKIGRDTETAKWSSHQHPFFPASSENVASGERKAFTNIPRLTNDKPLRDAENDLWYDTSAFAWWVDVDSTLNIDNNHFTHHVKTSADLGGSSRSQERMLYLGTDYFSLYINKNSSVSVSGNTFAKWDAVKQQWTHNDLTSASYLGISIESAQVLSITNQSSFTVERNVHLVQHESVDDYTFFGEENSNFAAPQRAHKDIASNAFRAAAVVSEEHHTFGASWSSSGDTLACGVTLQATSLNFTIIVTESDSKFSISNNRFDVTSNSEVIANAKGFVLSSPCSQVHFQMMDKTTFVKGFTLVRYNSTLSVDQNTFLFHQRQKPNALEHNDVPGNFIEFPHMTASVGTAFLAPWSATMVFIDSSISVDRNRVSVSIGTKNALHPVGVGIISNSQILSTRSVASVSDNDVQLQLANLSSDFDINSYNIDRDFEENTVTGVFLCSHPSNHLPAYFDQSAVSIDRNVVNVEAETRVYGIQSMTCDVFGMRSVVDVPEENNYKDWENCASDACDNAWGFEKKPWGYDYCPENTGAENCDVNAYLCNYEYHDCPSETPTSESSLPSYFNQPSFYGAIFNPRMNVLPTPSLANVYGEDVYVSNAMPFVSKSHTQLDGQSNFSVRGNDVRALGVGSTVVGVDVHSGWAPANYRLDPERPEPIGVLRDFAPQRHDPLQNNATRALETPLIRHNPRRQIPSRSTSFVPQATNFADRPDDGALALYNSSHVWIQNNVIFTAAELRENGYYDGSNRGFEGLGSATDRHDRRPTKRDDSYIGQSIYDDPSSAIDRRSLSAQDSGLWTAFHAIAMPHTRAILQGSSLNVSANTILSTTVFGLQFPDACYFGVAHNIDAPGRPQIQYGNSPYWSQTYLSSIAYYGRQVYVEGRGSSFAVNSNKATVEAGLPLSIVVEIGLIFSGSSGLFSISQNLIHASQTAFDVCGIFAAVYGITAKGKGSAVHINNNAFTVSTCSDVVYMNGMNVVFDGAVFDESGTMEVNDNAVHWTHNQLAVVSNPGLSGNHPSGIDIPFPPTPYEQIVGFSIGNQFSQNSPKIDAVLCKEKFADGEFTLFDWNGGIIINNGSRVSMERNSIDIASKHSNAFENGGNVPFSTTSLFSFCSDTVFVLSEESVEVASGTARGSGRLSVSGGTTAPLISSASSLSISSNSANIQVSPSTSLQFITTPANIYVDGRLSLNDNSIAYREQGLGQGDLAFYSSGIYVPHITVKSSSPLSVSINNNQLDIPVSEGSFMGIYVGICVECDTTAITVSNNTVNFVGSYVNQTSDTQNSGQSVYGGVFVLVGMNDQLLYTNGSNSAGDNYYYRYNKDFSSQSKNGMKVAQHSAPPAVTFTGPYTIAVQSNIVRTIADRLPLADAISGIYVFIGGVDNYESYAEGPISADVSGNSVHLPYRRHYTNGDASTASGVMLSRHSISNAQIDVNLNDIQVNIVDGFGVALHDTNLEDDQFLSTISMNRATINVLCYGRSASVLGCFGAFFGSLKMTTVSYQSISIDSSVIDVRVAGLQSPTAFISSLFVGSTAKTSVEIGHLMLTLQNSNLLLAGVSGAGSNHPFAPSPDIVAINVIRLHFNHADNLTLHMNTNIIRFEFQGTPELFNIEPAFIALGALLDANPSADMTGSVDLSFNLFSNPQITSAIIPPIIPAGAVDFSDSVAIPIGAISLNSDDRFVPAPADRFNRTILSIFNEEESHYTSRAECNMLNRGDLSVGDLYSDPQVFRVFRWNDVTPCKITTVIETTTTAVATTSAYESTTDGTPTPTTESSHASTTEDPPTMTSGSDTTTLARDTTPEESTSTTNIPIDTDTTSTAPSPPVTLTTSLAPPLCVQEETSESFQALFNGMVISFASSEIHESVIRDGGLLFRAIIAPQSMYRWSGNLNATSFAAKAGLSDNSTIALPLSVCSIDPLSQSTAIVCSIPSNDLPASPSLINIAITSLVSNLLTNTLTGCVVSPRDTSVILIGILSIKTTMNSPPSARTMDIVTGVIAGGAAILFILLGDGTAIEVQVLTLLLQSPWSGSEWDHTATAVLKYILAPFAGMGSNIAAVAGNILISLVVLILHVVAILTAKASDEDGVTTYKSAAAACYFPALTLMFAQALYAGIMQHALRSLSGSDGDSVPERVACGVLGLLYAVIVPIAVGYCVKSQGANGTYTSYTQPTASAKDQHCDTNELRSEGRFINNKKPSMWQIISHPRGNWGTDGERIGLGTFAQYHGMVFRWASLAIPFPVLLICAIAAELSDTRKSSIVPSTIILAISCVMIVILATLRPHRSIIQSVLSACAFGAVAIVCVGQIIFNTGNFSSGNNLVSPQIIEIALVRLLGCRSSRSLYETVRESDSEADLQNKGQQDTLRVKNTTEGQTRNGWLRERVTVNVNAITREIITTILGSSAWRSLRGRYCDPR